MKLSIIIPVFNEERTIARILRKVNNVDYGLPFEVLVINDGSTDGTRNVLMKMKNEFKNLRIISYERNRGKGYAVRKGMGNADGDILVIQDADLEYNPEQIPKLIRPILEGECKVVYGSRFLGECRNMSRMQIFANKFLTFMTNLLFFSSITDMETCYKVFHKDVLRRIELNSNRFEIEPEITAKILKAGFRIKEIPIEYSARKREEGKKINWADGIKALLMLLKVRISTK